MRVKSHTKIKISLWSIPILGIGLIFLVNAIFLHIAEAMVSKGYWLETKVSKGILLQNHKVPPELVFIGSSRTQNHINSQYFSTHGHPAFNYGVAGNLLWDYPHMVAVAGNTVSKKIIISFPAEFLFEPPQCPSYMSWLDLNFVLVNTPNCLNKAPLQLLADSLPINRVYTEPSALENYFPCGKLNRRDSIVKKIAPADATRICADDRGVLLIRGDESRYVAVFRNGDGLIFSKVSQDLQSQVEWIDKTKIEFNPEVIQYLRNLILPLQRKGKKVIFVIEAAPLKHVLINKNLEKLTGVQTLYMNEQNFEFSEMADLTHLNAQGNQRVTQWLYQHLF